MGKTIRSQQVLAGSGTYASIQYTNARAELLLRESDTDPKSVVDLVLVARATVRNLTSTEQTTPSGAVVASLSGDYSGSISASPKTLAANASGAIGDSVIVASIARASEPVSLSLTLSATGVVGSGGTKSVTFVVPPYKQMATNSNRRITYTVDGIKYDLLNYQ